MQRLQSADELGERRTLGAEDLALLSGLPGAGKLGIAAQLAYWRQHGRFPDDGADLAPVSVGHLVAQVGVDADTLEGYDLRLIQDYLGHRDPRPTIHYTRTAGRRFEGLWR
jgi:hypothetical protein